MSRALPLEGLESRCRNAHARELLREATLCFQVGALRSAVTNTWAAVACDLLAKIAELDLVDEPDDAALAACRQVLLRGEPEGDEQRRQHVAVERALLELSCARFQLISPLERRDLERLLQDRDRCVHPTLAPLAEPFTPSAEQVASHLRNAVELVLARDEHPGQKARARVLAEIESPYFPVDRDRARELLARGLLKGARATLVHALVRALAEALLARGGLEELRERRFTALAVIASLHPGPAAMTQARHVPRLVEALADGELGRVIAFLRQIAGAWELLDAAAQQRVRRYLACGRGDAATRALVDALEVAPLRADAARRIGRMSPGELLRLVDAGAHAACSDRVVHLFATARQLVDAEWIGRALLLPISQALRADQLRAVCDAVVDNPVFLDSWYVPRELLPALLARTDALVVNLADAWARLAAHYARPRVRDLGERLIARVHARLRGASPSSATAEPPRADDPTDERASPEGDDGAPPR